MMFAYCLFFAAVCLHLTVAFYPTEVQRLQGEADPDCECGPHGKCSFVDRTKKCECDIGFAESRHYCLEIPFPSWQLWQVEDSYLNFHVFPHSNKSRDINVLAMEMQYRKLNSAYANGYSALGSIAGQYYLEARLDDPTPYEFRFRLISDLESNAWSIWEPQPKPGPPELLPKAPVILEPKNNARLKLGDVRVAWKADSGERYGVRLGIKYSEWDHWIPYNTTYFQHVDNMLYYNTSFNLQRYPVLLGFVYRIDIVAFNDYGPSPIESVQFEVEYESGKVESFPWWLVAVVSGNVVLLALIALCCYCVKKRSS